MSQLLIKEKHFLCLFLTTTKDQQVALLDTLTPQQTQVISEILYNLLEINPKAKSVVEKRKRLFAQLVKGKLSLKAKTTFIQNHYKQVTECLLLVKKELLKFIT